MKATPSASTVKSLTIALLTATAALALAGLTWPRLESNFFPLFLAVVMLVSWYCGRGAGLVAAAFLGVSTHVFLRLLDPGDAMATETAAVVRLLTFSLAAVLISSLTAARRRAEAAERQQREWFEGTLSSLGEAVIATDLSGRVRFLNPIAQALTGWSPAEAFGKPLIDVYQAVDEESRKSALGQVMKVLQTGVAARSSAHSVLVGRDGGERPVDHSASPLRNTRGEIIGMVLVCRDITERKQAEKKITELSASLSRRVKVLQTILDVSPMGIAVAEDAECRRIWYNPALQKMLRLAPDANATLAAAKGEQAQFRLCRDGRDIEPDQLPMQYSTAYGVPVRDVEVDIILPDGTSYTVLNNVEPLFDDAGKVRGCLNFCVDITDRKRAEQALRESEAFYRTLGEAVPDFVWTCDPYGRLDFVNRRWQEFTGFSLEAFRQLGAEVLLHPDDRGPYLERWEDAIRGGQEFEKEARLRRSDGVFRWFMARAVPLRDAQGRVTKWVGTSTDIDDRKRAEEALRRNEERFRVALHGSAIAVFTQDKELRYTWIHNPNPSFPTSTVIGKTDLEIYEPETARQITALKRSVLEAGVRKRAEVEMVVGGRRLTHDLTLEPLRDASGAVVGLTGASADVTAVKRAEEARLRLAAIVETSDDAIVSATLDGVVTSWNEGAQRIFGYSAGDMIGRHLSTLAPADHADDVRGILEQIRKGDSVTHYETVRRRKDGQVIDISLTVSPLRDASGRVIGLSKIARDITERKRVDNQLREAKETAEAANQAKDRFLAVLSHELRTPLTPVLLTVSSMLTEEPSRSELRPTLEMIRRNVELEARLIDDLLDVMRIVRGKMPFNPEVVDAHALLRQTAEICRSDIETAELLLKLELSASEGHVQADPARLQQVYWNLVKNAVKFTPPGGTLTVRSRNEPHPDPQKRSPRLVMEFTDTGIGIDADFLPKVFDAFEQGETATWTRQHGGLGLGLAISQSVVQAQGGKLTARSAGRGQGSTFTLELDTVPAPAEAPAAAPPVHVPPEQVSQGAASLRILVVEDDPATLHAMAKLLGRLRYRVTTAGSVASALKAAEEGEFDLVISDLGLPDGNGLELMRQLRKQRSLKGIALSGFGMDEDVRKSREAGFVEHLTKPINFQTLEATIQSISTRVDGSA
jgi:PAS domain S-box-containing protein